jgi:hypothetical protein
LIRPWYLLPLAGQSADELDVAVSELRSRLMSGEVSIAEAAAQYQRAVPPGRYRRCLLGQSLAELM